MQIFAAESHAPRTRHVIDVATIVVGVLLLAGLILVTDDDSALEQRWFELADELPGWVTWLAEAIFLSGWIYFLFLVIGLGLVARRRLDLLRDLLVALVLPILAAIVLARLVSGEWPDIAILKTGDDVADSFPALSIAVLSAVQATASPHLSRPLRRFGWTMVVSASVASLVADLLLTRDVIGALLLGVVIAAVVHLVFGSPAGRPTVGRITTAAADLGVSLSELTYAPAQPESFTSAVGVDDAGERVRVSVLGRDAASDAWVAKAWRFAWYDEAGSPFGAGRRQKVEHAALVQVLAQRAGVGVDSLVAVGVGGASDALLVNHTQGTTLAELDPADVSDDLLDGAWAETTKLHAAGLCHGQLNANHVTFADGPQVRLIDFELGTSSPDAPAVESDRAELLVATALIVGNDRALGAARRAVGDAGLGETLAFLQPAALTPELRRMVHHSHYSIKELRAQAADLIGTDDIELQQLRRVSIGKVLMNVITVLAVYAVMTALAQIGVDEIVDSLQGATWSLVIVALVLTQLTNAAQAVAVVGAAPKPMPVGITTTEQFAISFINLAVPSTAARVAVNMRFYQRFGIGTTSAATAGLVTSVSGFVVQIFLLLLLILVGNESLDFSEFDFTGTVLKLIAVAVGVGVVSLIVILVVKRFRNWILDHIREPLGNVSDTISVLRSPRKLAEVFGGNLVEQLLYATGLTLCVLAVGGSVTLPEVIFINTVVSLFAGLMPIPGGIGVTEAGLSAGLVAVGVPQDTAFAAVIVYRLCSYYLPPIWGWFAMRWLTSNDYL